MSLDAGSFLCQLATGGLAFLWVTSRRREVGIGYGWLLRIVFGLLAIGAVALIATRDADGDEAATLVALVGSVGVVAGASLALTVSVVRRRAGVSGREADRRRRSERVAAMVAGAEPVDAPVDERAVPPTGPEFDPALDLIAPVAGVIALFGAAGFVGGDYPLAVARLLAGAALLGAVTDAMLLGHWYLTQPGLSRAPLKQLVVATGVVWPLDVAVLLISPGMVQVLDGTIDDGYGGLLGWVWLACAISTIALVAVTWLALRERYYSAVMSATGLLYLAILTAFGQDLIARAVLAP